ncbi:D-alanyl-D-alanine carboxypeptidase family protein [Bacillus sp. FSL K6-3431]|uniref:D-alanyl-D-alanine carboxypeptidase family protein n=1 Tax=Bacillus sp. FSL K6-3431 TaxID=2921500 RepID=UPI0030FC32A0
MRKLNKRGILLLMIILISCLAIATNEEPNIQSKSAILIDASSGKILFEKNAVTPFPVASISKMMTTYIVLEQIEKGDINWEEKVAISEVANNLEENAVKIANNIGDSLSVRDLYAAMVISSANNATKALAEHISGTEEAFTTLMNDNAGKMGLSKQTHFVNATGLANPMMDNAENTMTAKDVAFLAYNLLKDFPEVLEMTSQSDFYIESNNIALYNTNKMLDKSNKNTYLEEVDGLKTGFTDAAGYSFTGTALKGDKRLISVVLDAKDEDTRFIETKRLFSFGFGTSYISSFKIFIKSNLMKLEKRK